MSTVADWNYYYFAAAAAVVLLLRVVLKTLRGLSTGRYDYPSHPSPLLQKPNTKWEGRESSFSHHLSFQFQYGGRSPDPKKKKPLPFPAEVLFGFSFDFCNFCAVFWWLFFDCEICEVRSALGAWRGLREIDRREWAHGVMSGITCMPSSPRAHSSFCQPLSLRSLPYIQIHMWVCRANSIQFQDFIFFLTRMKVKPCL